MSRNIITVISSKIERKFNELLKIFHIKEVDLKHSEFDLKSLFRGLSIDDSKKIIFIQQALQGIIQKFVQSNSEWIKSYKVDFSTVEE